MGSRILPSVRRQIFHPKELKITFDILYVRGPSAPGLQGLYILHWYVCFRILSNKISTKWEDKTWYWLDSLIKYKRNVFDSAVKYKCVTSLKNLCISNVFKKQHPVCYDQPNTQHFLLQSCNTSITMLTCQLNCKCMTWILHRLKRR